MGRNNADFEGRPGALSAAHVYSTFELGDFTPNAISDAKDREPAQTKAALMKRKAEDAEDWDYRDYDSIVEHGKIHTPLEASWNGGAPRLEDGHTRLALMLRHHPDKLIPIRWVD